MGGVHARHADRGGRHIRRLRRPADGPVGRAETHATAEGVRVPLPWGCRWPVAKWLLGVWKLSRCETFLFCAQIFNGQDGKEKYPRRWIMLPPFL